MPRRLRGLAFVTPLAVGALASAQPFLNGETPPTPVVVAGDVPERVNVSFPSEADGVEIAGELLLPSGPGPFPGVLLISGRGPQTRDGVAAGQPVLGRIATRLAKAGIATLRCDDRGVGGSTGQFPGSTVDDLTLDAGGALAFLRRHPSVLKFRVGVVAHAEGGLSAVRLAAENRVPGPLVLIATQAVAGDLVIADEQAATLRDSGASDERIADVLESQRGVLNAMISDADERAMADAVAGLVGAHYRTHYGREPTAEFMRDNIPNGVEQARDPYMVSLAKSNPRADIEEIRGPVLALYGGRDHRVSDELNASAMSDALQSFPHPSSRVVVLPSKNHLMQNTGTGSASDYRTLGVAPAPDVLEIIATWVERQLVRSNERRGG
ncbi:MAG: CocE/NonD family hydrolase [Planctomycetota bacterium]